MDPRVLTARQDLVRQYDLSVQTARGMRRDSLALAQLRDWRGRLQSAPAQTRADSTAIDSLQQAASRLESGAGLPRARAGELPSPSLTRLQTELGRLYDVLQDSDAAPAAAHAATAMRLEQSLQDLEAQLRALLRRPVPGAP